MKAITLTQPWATLVAIGAKRIETRSWATNYHGEIAIHAAKGWTKDVVKLAMTEPFKGTLLDAGYKLFSLLPRGSVVAVATLVCCMRTEDVPILPPNRQFLETAFGDFTPRRFAWMLENVRALKEPIPAKGALGLWDWMPPSELVFK
jgi:hypothetical protein